MELKIKNKIVLKSKTNDGNLAKIVASVLDDENKTVFIKRYGFSDIETPNSIRKFGNKYYTVYENIGFKQNTILALAEALKVINDKENVKIKGKLL